MNTIIITFVEIWCIFAAFLFAVYMMIGADRDRKKIYRKQGIKIIKWSARHENTIR